MEAELPDFEDFSDFPKYLGGDVFDDEKIDDILPADIDKVLDNVAYYVNNNWNFEQSLSSSPLSSSVKGSQINPDDFLNDIDDSFASSDRSSPSILSSPLSSDNLKHDSSSSDESIIIDNSPPIFQNYLPGPAAVTTSVFPAQNAPIRILQGTLIPVSTIKIEASPAASINTQQQFVLSPGNRLDSRRKIVLPKPRAVSNNANKLAAAGLRPDNLLDERILKRQQRMIKNRESASISRNKKREYVMSLEVQVKSLLVENNVLKNENNNLRAQISSMLATCQCRVAQYSQFTKTLTSQSRKNTALLLAMIFMVSMSFGNLGTLLGGNANSDSNHLQDDAADHVGRSLLWNPDYTNLDDDDADNSLKNISSGGVKRVKCSSLLNQTENNRIETDLRKWIGINANLNTTPTSNSNIFDFMLGFDMFKSNYKNLYKTHRNYFKRKTLHLNHDWSEFKKRRMASHSASFAKAKAPIGLSSAPIQPAAAVPPPPASLPPPQKGRFSRLFKEIGRRDDTFYVLSFSNDHLVLSAANHNTSTRPRMSIVLPADDFHQNGKVALMQIDCEVMNTTVLQLRKEFIPQHLRMPNKMNISSSSVTTNNTQSYDVPNKHDLIAMSTDERHGNDRKPASFNKMYKPYFVEKTNFAKDTAADFSDVFIN